MGHLDQALSREQLDDLGGGVAAVAMHPSDAAIAEPLPEPERHDAIIRWWVRAEAVLKYAGTGIGHGLDGFPVLGGPARGTVPAGVDGRDGPAGCSYAALSAPTGYQAAIALPGLRMIRYRWGAGRP